MALVSYSDSEGSDTESPAPAPSLPPPKPKSSLSSFLPPPSKKRKLTEDAKPETSGPRKIKIDLPKITPLENDEFSSSSRSKIGKSAGGSGMLSFLPAPKRTGAEAVKVAQEAEKQTSTNNAATSNSGNTGTSAPRMLGGGIKKMEYAGTGMDMQPTVEDDPDEPASVSDKSAGVVNAPPAEPKPSGPVKGRAIQPFFRKTATKKSTKPGAGSVNTGKVEEKKVSLFSLGSALNEKPLTSTVTAGEYKPILIDDTPAPDVDDAPTEETSVQVEETESYHEIQGPQTFQSISEEVGMDEASMRMFMGRRGRNAEIKLVDFNVDEEYANNEAARKAGELAPEKNVVRSIKPGKHQLTSLLNAAQSQRAALEESFAQGRRNKKEAGSKYGW
ncbi:hypothetical protein TWF694_000511 [Orbilia ellipsospora]|uniref:Mitotic checkpoint regulator, MAD2B-interacting-domain-containing protein n=1 Tax=Orbilia ellipsospora TaxID=2528407 RepID=A0AAV9XRD5_9PEZI